MKKEKQILSPLSHKEEEILKSFAEIIPKLSKEDKSYLLGLGEGMAMMKEKTA